MSVVGWRAAYTDERLYNSVDDEWAELPSDGFLILRLYLDRYSGRDGSVQHTLTLSGEDHYFYDPKTHIFGANCDPIDDIKDRYPSSDIKRGMWVSDEDFRRMDVTIRELPCP